MTRPDASLSFSRSPSAPHHRQPIRSRLATAGRGLLAGLVGAAGLLAVAAAPLAAGDEGSAEAKPVERLDIVDRSIEHHGGELYTSSNTELVVTSRSGSFRVRSVLDDGRFDHTVTTVTDEGVERVVRATNESAERRDDGEVVELDAEAEQRARDFVNARIYFPFLPFRLNDPEVYKVDQGLQTWGERELHRVKVVFSPGSSTSASDDYVFFFDPETARLELYGYSFGTGQERGGLRFRTLENYRRVGGILFFDVRNHGISGEGDFSVDAIDEESVKEYELVSTVRLGEIAVKPLR